ncbi:MAG: DNRLRE domain-containing protein [Chloroflexi bacterium]|nr:DNRLRE domain-containing protein [Chloroflexota bacterium]
MGKKWSFHPPVIVSILVISSILTGCTLCGLYDDEDVFVAGSVWIDADRDGVRDDDEENANGVTVNLVSQDGTVIDSTTTNIGAYSFERPDDLPEGMYHLEFILPEGHEAIPEFGPYSNQVDQNGRSEDFYIAPEPQGDEPEQPVQEVNLGLARPGTTAAEEPTATEPSLEDLLSSEYDPLEDTVVTSMGSAVNYGEDPALWVDAYSAVFLRFPLEPLPENATLVSAVLDLFSDDSGTAGGLVVTLGIPAAPMSWAESALTFNTAPRMMDSAPPLEQQLMQYSGPGSKDTFDVASLYTATVQAYPGMPIFDIMIAISPTGDQGHSQGWSSREGLNPPKLTVTIKMGD